MADLLCSSATRASSFSCWIGNVRRPMATTRATSGRARRLCSARGRTMPEAPAIATVCTWGRLPRELVEHLVDFLVHPFDALFRLGVLVHMFLRQAAPEQLTRRRILDVHDQRSHDAF